jgi:hypothetical protein
MKRVLKSLLLSLRYKDLIYVVYSFIAYLVIKCPIHSFIYSIIGSYVVGFVLVLLCSLCISYLAKMFFEYLVKKIKCDYILNQYVLENMLPFVVNNFTLVYTDILCFIGSNNKKEKKL